MFQLITRGLAIGFGAASTPGPFKSFVIATTLAHGWRVGIVTIFSPLIVDIPIIILTTFLLAQIPESIFSVIQIIGGLFVLYIAWKTWKQLRAGVAFKADPDAAPQQARQTLLQAMTMNALSPGPYIFWGTINGPILREALDQSVLHGLSFLVGFYGAFLGVLAIVVFVFNRLRTVDPRVTNAILLLAIVVLAGLGISLIRDGISGLI